MKTLSLWALQSNRSILSLRYRCGCVLICRAFCERTDLSHFEVVDCETGNHSNLGETASIATLEVLLCCLWPGRSRELPAASRAERQIICPSLKIAVSEWMLLFHSCCNIALLYKLKQVLNKKTWKRCLEFLQTWWYGGEFQLLRLSDSETSSSFENDTWFFTLGSNVATCPYVALSQVRGQTSGTPKQSHIPHTSTCHVFT